MENKIRLSHSYSSIKQYENCPYRYYHQRIAKTVVDKPNDASMHGERVHKFLEDRIKEKADLPVEVQHLEPIIQSLENVAKSGDLFAELEFTLTQDLKPTTWFAPDAWLRSKLDVYVSRKPVAMVVDWKTGKRRPDFMQLELFALQVFAHYPEVNTVTSSFIWTRDNAMDRETYGRADAPALWDKMLTKISRIEKSLEHDNWPAKPSGLCGWCPCKNFCEYAR